VDVNDDGAVGVTFYDFRNDMPDTATALTDYWFRASTDGATSWESSQRVTPESFDMKKAPVARGFFVGDYEGLDNFGSTFTPFFVQAIGTHATPDTDAYYSTAGP
jgi:hypothetical protein